MTMSFCQQLVNSGRERSQVDPPLILPIDLKCNAKPSYVGNFSNKNHKDNLAAFV
jgi:hypothetical protein